MLGRLSQGAEVVVQVLSKASEESLLPGRLMERLLLSFLLIKVRSLARELPALRLPRVLTWW